MRKNRKSSERGHTLVETGIASLVLLLTIGGTYTAIDTGAQTWTGVVDRTHLQGKSRESMREVSEELKRAGPLEIDTSSPLGDIVTFKVPLEISGGVITWGAAKGGGEVAGAFVQYLVVKHDDSGGATHFHLVRRLLDANRQVIAGTAEVMVRHVRPPHVGWKPFRISKTGELVKVELDVERRRGREATGQRVSLETTIHARNMNAEAALGNEAPTEPVATTPGEILAGLAEELERMASNNIGTLLFDTLTGAITAVNDAVEAIAGEDTATAIDEIDTAITKLNLAKTLGLMDPATATSLISKLQTEKNRL